MTNARDAAEKSRADAGLTQNTDMANSYEAGFEMGWSDALKSEAVMKLINNIKDIIDNKYHSKCWTCDGGERNHEELVEAFEQFNKEAGRE